jgi:hypothetical protein
MSTAQSSRSPLDVSVNQVEFGKVAVLSPSAPQLIDLKNTNRASVVIQKVFASSEEFSLTQNCSTGKPLPAGDNCTIVVTFTPQETGIHKGVITILVLDVGLMNIALTGDGVESNVALSGNHLVFHDQLVNTRGDMQMMRVENRGTTPLSIKSIAVPAGFTLLPAREQCMANGTVKAKGYCVLALSFSPVSEGLLNGIVTIEDSDAASPHRIGLSGRATAIKLSSPSLVWDNTATGVTSDSQSVLITNESNSPVRIEGIDARGEFVEHNDCPKELSARQTCTVSVAFQPKLVGKASGAIRIHDSDITAMQTVLLNGTSVALEMSPTQIDFGKEKLADTTSPMVVVITNHGTTAANLTSIGVKGDFVMPAKSCGEVLEAAQSCKVSVSFSPTANGPRNGMLTVNTASGGLQSAALSGVGTPK